MKITSKGQVTIPIGIREQLGLHPETEVEFRIAGAEARLRKAHNGGRRGRMVVSRLRGTATSRLNTDQILSLTRG